MRKEPVRVARLLSWAGFVLACPSLLALQHGPTLQTTINRMSAYVANYLREVTAIVAEEVYEQQVTRFFNVTVKTLRGDRNEKSRSTETRRLVSDFLMVQVPGGAWLPFRDVFEVDGRRVRDRQDRLQKLFLEETSATALEKAKQIREESARYNLGNFYRDFNVPTLALTFGAPESIGLFKFSKKREQAFNGLRVWVLAFREEARPTVVRTVKGEDVPSSGELWVDPENGIVVRTMLDVARSIITVTYGPRAETPGLWMPVEMKESYQLAGSADIVCTATYSSFRRFQVTTEEKLAIPK